MVLVGYTVTKPCKDAKTAARYLYLKKNRISELLVFKINAKNRISEVLVLKISRGWMPLDLSWIARGFDPSPMEPLTTLNYPRITIICI